MTCAIAAWTRNHIRAEQLTGGAEFTAMRCQLAEITAHCDVSHRQVGVIVNRCFRLRSTHLGNSWYSTWFSTEMVGKSATRSTWIQWKRKFQPTFLSGIHYANTECWRWCHGTAASMPRRPSLKTIPNSWETNLVVQPLHYIWMLRWAWVLQASRVPVPGNHVHCIRHGRLRGWIETSVG